MIYETEAFVVEDVDTFRQQFEALRASLEQAGATEVRLFRGAREPNRVLASCWWPDLESCQRFAAEHEEEFGSIMATAVQSAEPSQQWEQV